MPENIYFDHNATTVILPEVLREMQGIYALGCLNPSSVHAAGRSAKKLLNSAKERIKAALCADGFDVIFTSSGTEANNLAITAAIDGFVTASEHESIIKPAVVKGFGIVGVNQNGAVDLTDLEGCLQNVRAGAVVSVMHANNQTGVLNDMQEILKITKKYGAILHTDCAQSVGKIPVNAIEMGVDIMTFSGHKIHGPLGIGVALKKRDVILKPLFFGGGQEGGVRSGTENLPNIMACTMAMEIVTTAEYLEGYAAQTSKIIGFIEDSVVALGGSVIAHNSERVPNTSMLVMPGKENFVQLMLFDAKGIHISVGAACSSGRVEASHVLAAMGIPTEIARCAIRISVDVSNTMLEAERFVQVWREIKNGHHLV